MSNTGKLVVALIWAIIAAEALVISQWYTANAKNLATAAMDPAGVILMVGAVAVGIERVIEYLWMLVGLATGSFWPISTAAKFMTGLADDVGRSLAPRLDQAKGVLAALAEAQAVTVATAAEFSTRLDSATTQLESLRKSVKHSQGALTYASAASDVANNASAQMQALLGAAVAKASTPAERLTLATSLVRSGARVDARRRNPQNLVGAALDTWVDAEATSAVTAWTTAVNASGNAERAVSAYLSATPLAHVGAASAALSTSITSVTDFLATFKDNPGRRMLSLQIGIAIGLAIAGAAGLDIYAGVMNDGAAPDALVAATVAGILFTGVLIGLGSSPTHEVIRVLQESKAARKASNAAATDAPDLTADGIEMGGAFLVAPQGAMATRRAAVAPPMIRVR